MGRLIAALLFVPLASACLSLAWVREHRDQPPPENWIEDLRPGEADLEQCLNRLGAPLYVWEYKGEGMALAWGWVDNDRKGFTFSVPLADEASASFSYDRIDERMRGVVLLFDRDLKLELARSGYLRDLSRDYQRRRPADTSTLP